MIRAFSLLWTLIVAVAITALSFYYINGETRGFPFAFAREVEVGGYLGFEYNTWTLIFDLIFWWLLFSILWVVVKNYIFDS
jgi:hypothetical protein